MGNMKAFLATQVPLVSLFLGATLNGKYETIEQVLDILEGAKDNTIPATPAAHMSSRPVS